MNKINEVPSFEIIFDDIDVEVEDVEFEEIDEENDYGIYQTPII